MTRTFHIHICASCAAFSERNRDHLKRQKLLLFGPVNKIKARQRDKKTFRESQLKVMNRAQNSSRMNAKENRPLDLLNLTKVDRQNCQNKPDNAEKISTSRKIIFAQALGKAISVDRRCLISVCRRPEIWLLWVLCIPSPPKGPRPGCVDQQIGFERERDLICEMQRPRWPLHDIKTLWFHFFSPVLFSLRRLREMRNSNKSTSIKSRNCHAFRLSPKEGSITVLPM